MSTSQTSFQDRLKKIENKQATEPSQASAAPATQEKAEPEFGAGPKRESPIGTGTLMIAGGVVGLLALGAVLFRDVMAPPEDLTAAVMADGGPRQVSLLGRLLGGTFDPQSVQAQLPVYHLPDAPTGYIRATRSDVRKMSAVDKLRAQWPEGSGANYVTLEQNPGFKALSKFVALSQVKSKKIEEQAKYQAVAHYLSSTGAHLFVTIRFLPEDQNLGPQNAPTAWAEKLFASGLAFDKGSPRIAEFGNHVLIGRGRASLDPTSTSPTKMDIVVPLTPQVIMRVAGNAPPTDLDALIRNVSVPALLAFAG